MKKLVAISLSLLLTACGGGEGGNVADDPQARDYSEFFTALPTQALYPTDNPYNATKEQLGEFLFWDPILSGDKTTSCASCHHPDFGWADGRRFSIGHDGVGAGPNRLGSQVTDIHSPTVMNVAFTGLTITTQNESFTSGGYFWDLRADTLEEQALGPIQNPIEMLGHEIPVENALPLMVERLNSIPEYVELFEQAFGYENAINSENIGKALATFQRKIISPNTRFDQFINGNTNVFNQQEIIGLNKFIDGGCTRCHTGPMLSDNQVHDGEAIINDEVVRTPTLRNLGHTAPYMHDGSRATLIDAIAAYEDREDLETPIGEGDFADIAAFLNTLNTDNFYRGKPQRLPSGLTVGGNIN
ncbi:MAG: cytochrome-c peroxidase [Psychrobium sp.]